MSKKFEEIKEAIRELSQQMKLINNGGHPYTIGSNYFIRTVTHYLTGKLIQVTKEELILVDAAWVASTGRFMQAIQDGTLSEVEPYPTGMQVVVSRAAVIDACKWTHQLPRNQV